MSYSCGGNSDVLHGYSIKTGDMDRWLESTAAYRAREKAAFQEIEMPVYWKDGENFLQHPAMEGFTIAAPPVAIDPMI